MYFVNTNTLKNRYKKFTILLKDYNFFLDGYLFSQKEINNFIETCKYHEDQNGLIKVVFLRKN